MYCRDHRSLIPSCKEAKQRRGRQKSARSSRGEPAFVCNQKADTSGSSLPFALALNKDRIPEDVAATLQLERRPEGPGVPGMPKPPAWGS
jgi:hypothetical protein